MERRDVVSAFTEEQVEQLTGITVGQLRYWDQTGFFVPSFAHENRRVALSRLYSFRDVASLRVIARLRSRVPLQRLRRVKIELDKLGDDMWSKTTLWVHGRDVAFINPETGRPEDVVSGQGLLKIELEEISDALEDDIRRLYERDPATVGEIHRNRHIMHNKEVVAGTRIPVSAIRAFHDAGYSIAEIAAEYPTLTEADIRAALDMSRAA